MKKLFLILIIGFSVNSFAQVDTVKQKLRDLNFMLKKATFDKIYWEMATMSDNTPEKTSAIVSTLNSYLETPSKNPNDYYINKYKQNFKSLFTGLTLFGTDQSAAFIFNKKTKLPINFCLNVDTSLTLLLSSVYIDNVYNTIKLSSRQRATKVLTTYLIPQFKKISENFVDSDIKYFGFTAVYGSIDLVDETSKPKAELVAIVAPYTLIKKYVQGSITEDEIVAGSEIWISDRDAITDFKKIKIVLE